MKTRELRYRKKSCLVHDEGVALLEVGDALVGKVQHTAGRADQDVHDVVKTHDVVLQRRASGRDLSNGDKTTVTINGSKRSKTRRPNDAEIVYRIYEVCTIQNSSCGLLTLITILPRGGDETYHSVGMQNTRRPTYCITRAKAKDRSGNSVVEITKLRPVSL